MTNIEEDLQKCKQENSDNINHIINLKKYIDNNITTNTHESSLEQELKLVIEKQSKDILDLNNKLNKLTETNLKLENKYYVTKHRYQNKINECKEYKKLIKSVGLDKFTNDELDWFKSDVSLLQAYKKVTGIWISEILEMERNGVKYEK